MWYLAMRTAVKPRAEWTATLEEHLSWMKEQHEQGSILISGPTRDRKYGIYLIRAGSREEAEAVAASDPFTACGGCTFELLEWDVHQLMGVGPFTAGGLH